MTKFLTYSGYVEVLRDYREQIEAIQRVKPALRSTSQVLTLRQLRAAHKRVMSIIEHHPDRPIQIALPFDDIFPHTDAKGKY